MAQTPFDWEAAEEALFRMSEAHVRRFLEREDAGDVYGVGFFCDPLEGVLLVANTRKYLDQIYQDFAEKPYAGNPEEFRWDIGNWEYPAGLFPSSSVEQMEFESGWEAFQELLSEWDDDELPGMLEDLCVRVLKRLKQNGVFSAAGTLEGFMILGPDDPTEAIPEKKERLDDVLKV